MSEKVAVYPGSFNPVHPGHLHVIRQAAQVFDRVIVLIELMKTIGKRERKKVSNREYLRSIIFR